MQSLDQRDRLPIVLHIHNLLAFFYRRVHPADSLPPSRIFALRDLLDDQALNAVPVPLPTVVGEYMLQNQDVRIPVLQHFGPVLLWTIQPQDRPWRLVLRFRPPFTLTPWTAHSRKRAFPLILVPLISSCALMPLSSTGTRGPQTFIQAVFTWPKGFVL